MLTKYNCSSILELFQKNTLEELVFWIGKISLGNCSSVNAMAMSLSSQCKIPHSTIRRWLSGGSKPNASQILLICAIVCCEKFNGDMNDMVNAFATRHGIFQEPI